MPKLEPIPSDYVFDTKDVEYYFEKQNSDFAPAAYKVRLTVPQVLNFMRRTLKRKPFAGILTDWRIEAVTEMQHYCVSGKLKISDGSVTGMMYTAAVVSLDIENKILETKTALYSLGDHRW